MEENRKIIIVALNVDYLSEIVILIAIHLFGLTFHQYLRVVSCLVRLEILANCCSIR